MRLLISGSWVRAPRWALFRFVFLCFNLCFQAHLSSYFEFELYFASFQWKKEKTNSKQKIHFYDSKLSVPVPQSAMRWFWDTRWFFVILFTWPVISPFACSSEFSTNLGWLLAIIGFHGSRFVVYVSHNNVWRHWRKNFLEEFCLLIVIILFLLHNYFIIPKLASTRSNRAKRVQNCLSLFIRQDWAGALWGSKMKKE